MVEHKIGIKHSVKAFNRKFIRMRQESTTFRTKIMQPGRDGDDDNLYNLTPFYQEMNELERKRKSTQ